MEPVSVDYDTMLNFSLLRTLWLPLPMGGHWWDRPDPAPHCPRLCAVIPGFLLAPSWEGWPCRQSQGEAPTGCSHSCSARLFSAGAAHLFSSVLEYQPGPWLSWLRLQGVIFNPSIQSVSRGRRRSIRHMLTSAPRRAGGVSQRLLG